MLLKVKEIQNKEELETKHEGLLPNSDHQVPNHWPDWDPPSQAWCWDGPGSEDIRDSELLYSLGVRWGLARSGHSQHQRTR